MKARIENPGDGFQYLVLSERTTLQDVPLADLGIQLNPGNIDELAAALVPVFEVREQQKILDGQIAGYEASIAKLRERRAAL